MQVYQAISNVASEMAKEGISKDRKNQQQGYSFRGIDDVYNALAPIISKHSLCILPRVIGRECVERINKNGTALFYVTVEAEFDFVSAEDGSKHTVKTFGEAMDSADKATNKAMSAAYKYAAMQAFCIPTEGDNDADATTHEVEPKAHKEPPKNDATRNLYEALQQKITDAKTSADLGNWWKSEQTKKDRASLPSDWHSYLETECGKRGRELKASESNPLPRGADKDVSTIKEMFPGARVNNETIHDGSGRELNNMEAAE